MPLEKIPGNTFRKKVKDNPKDRIGLFVQLRRKTFSFHCFAYLSPSFWRLVTPMAKADFLSMLWAIFHSKPRFVYFHVVRFFNHLQIFWPVIAFNVINVVYQLVITKFPPYSLFSDKYRIKNITRFPSSTVLWFPNPQITILASITTPVVQPFASCFNLSLWRNVLPFKGFPIAYLRTIFFGLPRFIKDFEFFLTYNTSFNHRLIITK